MEEDDPDEDQTEKGTLGYAATKIFERVDTIIESGKQQQVGEWVGGWVVEKREEDEAVRTRCWGFGVGGWVGG